MTQPPPQRRWARLKGDAQVGLRRGAWYRVLELAAQEVVVDAAGKRVRVSRRLLQLAGRPDPAWTVVNAPRSARTSTGSQYAVCPSCKERAPLPAQAMSELRCPRCNNIFAIDWSGTGG